MTENESIRSEGEPTQPAGHVPVPPAVEPAHTTAEASAGPVDEAPQAAPPAYTDFPPQTAAPDSPGPAAAHDFPAATAAPGSPAPAAADGSPAAAYGSPAAPTPGSPAPAAYGYPGGAPASPPAAGEPQTAQFPAVAHASAVPPSEGQPPTWLQAAAASPAPGPGRFAKVAAASIAAIGIALASGLGGAMLALQLDDRGLLPGTTIVREAAPVVDRSSLASIANKVQPSVVSINTGTGEGSGVVMTEDGYILTNNHVVSGARSLRVTFSTGKSATATVVGTDPRTDLAVIKAQGVSGLTAATFGNSDDMQIGDSVLALGSPLGLEGSVTAGIVSAMNRTIQAGDGQSRATAITGAIQTDAAINPGNSGGALVNLNGEVIGINTAIATAGGGNGNIGVGFAIPSNKAKQVADQLMKGQRVSHAYLGVEVTTAENGGAELRSVAAGSPAEKAGLRVGDVVTKIGDKDVNDKDDLVSAVQSGKVGDRLEVGYTRDGSEQTTTVTLGEAS